MALTRQQFIDQLFDLSMDVKEQKAPQKNFEIHTFLERGSALLAGHTGLDDELGVEEPTWEFIFLFLRVALYYE